MNAKTFYTKKTQEQNYYNNIYNPTTFYKRIGRIHIFQTNFQYSFQECEKKVLKFLPKANIILITFIIFLQNRSFSYIRITQKFL